MTVKELIMDLLNYNLELPVRFATGEFASTLEILSIYDDTPLYPEKGKAKVLWIDLG